MTQRPFPLIPDCVEISGRSVPLLVRFHKGARYMRLRLNYKNQVIVSAPLHLSVDQVMLFLENKRLWLEQQIASTSEITRLSDWLKKYPFLSASGMRFHVCVRSENCQRAQYRFEKEGPTVILSVPQNSESPEYALLKLAQIFSRDALVCRLNELARQLNLEFSRLTVRDQTSRWGSCSGKRTISLNWRLVLLEPGLQDYVILHELAHLTEMNHSKRFWNLLDSYDPYRQKHESALKEISDAIMRIGRS